MKTHSWPWPYQILFIGMYLSTLILRWAFQQSWIDPLTDAVFWGTLCVASSRGGTETLRPVLFWVSGACAVTATIQLVHQLWVG